MSGITASDGIRSAVYVEQQQLKAATGIKSRRCVAEEHLRNGEKSTEEPRRVSMLPQRERERTEEKSFVSGSMEKDLLESVFCPFEL